MDFLNLDAINANVYNLLKSVRNLTDSITIHLKEKVYCTFSLKGYTLCDMTVMQQNDT